MSCTYVILNYEGPPPHINEEMPDGKPLGSSEEVRKQISSFLPKVHWSKAVPTQGAYRGSDFSIEFDIGDSDPVESVILRVIGEGNAASALLLFATPNGWSILDCSKTEFLGADDRSNGEFDKAQSPADHVMPIHGMQATPPRELPGITTYETRQWVYIQMGPNDEIDDLFENMTLAEKGLGSLGPCTWGGNAARITLPSGIRLQCIDFKTEHSAVRAVIERYCELSGFVYGEIEVDSIRLSNGQMISLKDCKIELDNY